MIYINLNKVYPEGGQGPSYQYNILFSNKWMKKEYFYCIANLNVIHKSNSLYLYISDLCDS